MGPVSSLYLRIRTNPELHLPVYKKASIFVLHTTVYSMMGLIVNFLFVIFTGQAIGYRGSTSAVENEAEFALMVGSVSSIVIISLGSSLYPDWNNYWMYT